jgi:hypothetical protein
MDQVSSEVLNHVAQRIRFGRLVTLHYDARPSQIIHYPAKRSAFMVCTAIGVSVSPQEMSHDFVRYVVGFQSPSLKPAAEMAQDLNARSHRAPGIALALQPLNKTINVTSEGAFAVTPHKPPM